MGHSLLAVFFRHPAEYFGTPVIIEVDVYIGHGDTIRIEKTLEKQMVLDRIDIRDPQTVSYRRTGCRSSAGSDRDAHTSCGCNEILYNKEVAGEPHSFDGFQFKVDTLFYLIGKILSILAPGPFVGKETQVVIIVFIFGGDRKVRHQGFVVDAVELYLVKYF